MQEGALVSAAAFQEVYMDLLHELQAGNRAMAPDLPKRFQVPVQEQDLLVLFADNLVHVLQQQRRMPQVCDLVHGVQVTEHEEEAKGGNDTHSKNLTPSLV